MAFTHSILFFLNFLTGKKIFLSTVFYLPYVTYDVEKKVKTGRKRTDVLKKKNFYKGEEYFLKLIKQTLSSCQMWIQLLLFRSRRNDFIIIFTPLAFPTGARRFRFSFV